MRIASLDLIRGAVMVLMALDHVRVFSGVPAGGPTPGVFFTRWITHFCAPAFFFLAGAGAFLHGEKLGSRGALARYLLVRGAWLVLLELTVLRWAWTFNFDYAHYVLAGVVWALGWCMMLLAGLVYLPPSWIAGLAVVIVAGHNLADPRIPGLVPALQASPAAALWQVLYFGPLLRPDGGSPLVVLYSLVPWIGVMSAGYVFGRVMRMQAEARRRVCLGLGLGAIAAFLVLRGFDVYGDPRPWSRASGGPAALSFLNTTKYPASLLFLLMTLGPTIALIPLLEKARGPLARALTVFGRVPFFYYLLHIPLIHAVACLVSLARDGRVAPWLFENHPMMAPAAPAGYAWSLGLLYLVTAGVVATLYLPCRRFAELKARRKEAWLSFL